MTVTRTHQSLRRYLLLVVLAGTLVAAFVAVRGDAARADRNGAAPALAEMPDGIEVVAFTDSEVGRIESSDGNAAWVIVEYDTNIGTCLEAELTNAATSAGVIGCAQATDLEEQRLTWNIGTVDVGIEGGEEIAYGQVVEGIETVSMLLTDGSRVSVAVSDGRFSFARRATGDESFVVSFDGLDASGETVVTRDVGAPTEEPTIEWPDSDG